jgi:hypothetical protein
MTALIKDKIPPIILMMTERWAEALLSRGAHWEIIKVLQSRRFKPLRSPFSLPFGQLISQQQQRRQRYLSLAVSATILLRGGLVLREIDVKSV